MYVYVDSFVTSVVNFAKKSQSFDIGSVYVYREFAYSVKQKRSPIEKYWGRHCIVYIMEMYV